MPAVWAPIRSAVLPVCRSIELSRHGSGDRGLRGSAIAHDATLPWRAP